MLLGALSVPSKSSTWISDSSHAEFHGAEMSRLNRLRKCSGAIPSETRWPPLRMGLVRAPHLVLYPLPDWRSPLHHLRALPLPVLGRPGWRGGRHTLPQTHAHTAWTSPSPFSLYPGLESVRRRGLPASLCHPLSLCGAFGWNYTIGSAAFLDRKRVVGRRCPARPTRGAFTLAARTMTIAGNVHRAPRRAAPRSIQACHRWPDVRPNPHA